MNALTGKEEPPAIYFGTSGIALPVANKQLFPESFRNKSRLEYYSTFFNSLEINSTFKKLPRATTIEKWAASVSPDFHFTFKLPASLTHNKGLSFQVDDIPVFLNIVAHAGNKSGCLLVQFPGQLTVEYIRELDKLLSGVKAADPENRWKIAVEFRHVSWYKNDTWQLLNSYEAALVLHDMPPAAPELHTFTGGFIYLRFHGTEKGYRGSYPDQLLLHYAKHIRHWQSEGKPVYIYFNNTLGAAAVNLISLKNFLKD